MIAAVITDSMMAEPIVVVCEDMASAHEAVATYLAAAAPVRVDTGERVTPKPPTAEVVSWVTSTLDEVEDISVDFLEAVAPGTHQLWCTAAQTGLRRMHEPRVQTIKVADGRL